MQLHRFQQTDFRVFRERLRDVHNARMQLIGAATWRALVSLFDFVIKAPRVIQRMTRDRSRPLLLREHKG